MTDLRTAAQQALEALQAYGSHVPNCDHLVLLTSLPPQRKPCSCGLSDNITALRAALAEPVQEPHLFPLQSNRMRIDPVTGDVGIGTPSAEPVQEPDLSRCPQCGGPADNGHDRSIPPTPYWCTKCMVEPVPDSKHATIAQWWADKQRKPLTGEEVRDLCERVPDFDIGTHDLIVFARAIEAAHGIKDD